MADRECSSVVIAGSVKQAYYYYFTVLAIRQRCTSLVEVQLDYFGTYFTAL